MDADSKQEERSAFCRKKIFDKAEMYHRQLQSAAQELHEKFKLSEMLPGHTTEARLPGKCAVPYAAHTG